MKHFIACVFLLGLILAGCAGSSADPDLVAKAVQGTLTASAPTAVQGAVSPAAESSLSTPTSANAPIVSAEPTAEVKDTDIPTRVPTATSEPTATPAPTDTPLPTATPEPAATPTPAAPYVVASKAVNLRSGPGTNYPVVGAASIGKQYEITGRNPDGAWLEICCVNDTAAWVAKSVVTTGGDAGGVKVAENIPAPPPTPTPKPTSPPAPAVQRPGMHTRIQIGTWEIQAERVQNEKAVYQYNSSKVAMGRYAIVFVLAKNLASGTQSISATLGPALKDDKGRIYDYSDPLTTERLAMIYATWEFSVGKTVFDDINPGVETPLLMLWDVNEDVQSLVLILTDGRNRVEWDLGNFSNIPPYKP